MRRVQQCCLVVLQAEKGGKTILKATSEGLEADELVFLSAK